MVIGTQGISSSRSGKEAESTPSAETTHPHKSVLEPLLFAVYKQVTQTHNLRNLILAYILHDSQILFSATPNHARNYPSEKCFNIPRDVSIYREELQCSEWCFRVYAFIFYFYSTGMSNKRQIRQCEA